MNDDIHIDLGNARVRSAAPDSAPPSGEPSLYTAAYLDAGKSALPVYISLRALVGIREHAASCGDREVGGALVGTIFHHKGKPYVKVEDFIVATDAGERKTSLTFTHETWNRLNLELDRRGTGLNIVGWYHTYPEFGAFMSEKDEFIHRNFFGSDGMVALVVDPVWSEWSFFHGSGEELTKSTGFFIFGEAGEQGEIDSLIAQIQPKQRAIYKRITREPTMSKKTRRRLIAVGIVALLLVSIFVGQQIWQVISEIRSENKLVADRVAEVDIKKQSTWFGKAAQKAFNVAKEKVDNEDHAGARRLYLRLLSDERVEKTIGLNPNEQNRWIRLLITNAGSSSLDDHVVCLMFNRLAGDCLGGKPAKERTIKYIEDLTRQTKKIINIDDGVDAVRIYQEILKHEMILDKSKQRVQGALRLASLTENHSERWNAFTQDLFPLVGTEDNNEDNVKSHSNACQFYDLIVEGYLKHYGDGEVEAAVRRCDEILADMRDKKAVTNITKFNDFLNKYRQTPKLSVGNKAKSEE